MTAAVSATNAPDRRAMISFRDRYRRVDPDPKSDALDVSRACAINGKLLANVLDPESRDELVQI